MKQYLILARSITYAQRMQRTLSQTGIRADVFRAPMELTGGRGCAYAVQIGASHLPGALRAINGAGLGPVQVYVTDPNQDGYQEVIL